MEITELYPDPILQFQAWFLEAQKVSGMEFPDTMALATADVSGRPSVRMVLFKGINNSCFTFVTSYESRKARDLEANPYGALCFFWDWTGHQVRIEGKVARLPKADSDDYFRRRPRSSQLGAWASPQSREIASRADLEKRVADAEAKFSGIEIPRPENWGGFGLEPGRIEFWKNGAHRLHDRFEYSRPSGGGWTTRRLAP